LPRSMETSSQRHPRWSHFSSSCGIARKNSKEGATHQPDAGIAVKKRGEKRAGAPGRRSAQSVISSASSSLREAEAPD
jgi:hypothetical protein